MWPLFLFPFRKQSNKKLKSKNFGKFTCPRCLYTFWVWQTNTFLACHIHLCTILMPLHQNLYERCFTMIEFLMYGKLFKFFSKVIFYVIKIHLTTWPRAQSNNTFHNNIPSSCKPNVSGVIWRIFGKRFGSFLIFHSDLDKFYGFYGQWMVLSEKYFSFRITEQNIVGLP